MCGGEVERVHPGAAIALEAQKCRARVDPFGFIPESQAVVEEVAHIQILGDHNSGSDPWCGCRPLSFMAGPLSADSKPFHTTESDTSLAHLRVRGGSANG
jgi:hypothetical protein